ncbi:hypothetical protein JTB14_037636 [Gonioctena quinquepunctata]|nr:hypothetical protein JTB14_037636 [Gonioctena quinquepunctata]
MFLDVDRPKQVSGNFNDDITARRFLSDPQLAASITGVDITLIHRISVKLGTMSCGYIINTEKFNKYAEETSIFHVDLYNCFYMPTSGHEILIHGAEVINSASLPIGQLSEEAMEPETNIFDNIASNIRENVEI